MWRYTTGERRRGIALLLRWSRVLRWSGGELLLGRGGLRWSGGKLLLGRGGLKWSGGKLLLRRNSGLRWSGGERLLRRGGQGGAVWLL